MNPDGSGSTVPVPTPKEVFAAAKTLGMSLVIDPYTAPDRWTSVEQIEETAKALNAAAVIAKDHGLRVGYHNHAHELEASFDGVTGLEVLASMLSADVALEVDLYWAARAGVDVPALLTRLGERVKAVHVKDGTLAPDLVDASTRRPTRSPPAMAASRSPRRSRPAPASSTPWSSSITTTVTSTRRSRRASRSCRP